MKRTLFILLLFATHSFADVNHLPVELRKILYSSTFMTANSVGDLPSSVVSLCADESGRLANPGQDWQLTDVIIDETLPRKRLIWVARFQNVYAVHYERGGYAHSFHLLLTRLNKENKPVVIWRAIGSRFEDFQSFLDALKQNKLDDDVKYYH